jgi:TolB-like protein
MPEGRVYAEDEQLAVRQALEELLAWPPMARSPRLSAFLSYIVDAALMGRSDSVKAYSIAVDVFGREENFDPQSDPIVRVQARRLRGLIEEYDKLDLGSASMRIVLPVGRYVPDFVPREDSRPAVGTDGKGPDSAEDGTVSRPPQSPSRSIWVAGAAAALLLIASLYFWPELGQRTASGPAVVQPVMPLVIIEDFENLTDDQRSTPLVAGLALELVTDLNQFSDLSARYGGPQADPREVERANGGVYVLSGVARRSPRGILYSILLQDAPTRSVVATFEVEVPLDAGAPNMNLQDVSEQFSLRLGSPRGPLHKSARSWIEEHAAEDDPVLEPYPCLVAYGMFREQRAVFDAGGLERCARQSMTEEWPEGAAILAFLTAEEGWRAGTDTAEGAALIDEARELAQRAIAMEPTSGFNWALRAQVAFLAGDIGRARDDYNTAVQLNPAMVDVLADYGYVESLNGNWETARALSQRALSVEVDPPDFYSIVPALWAMRQGDYAQAAAVGERMVSAVPDLGTAVMVAAGGQLRDAEIINAYLPRLLASQRFRRLGIMPALRQHVLDPDLLRAISSGIISAGVPLDRLANPF